MREMLSSEWRVLGGVLILIPLSCHSSGSGDAAAAGSGGSGAPAGGVNSSAGAPVIDGAGEGGVSGVSGMSEAGASGDLQAGGASGQGGGDAGEGGAAGEGGQGPISAGCVQALSGTYIARTDGALLVEIVNGLAYSEQAVLDAESGLPLKPVSSVQDGHAHGCATLAGSDGAWCWRTDSSGNTYGQTGNGAPDSAGSIYRATRVLTAPNTPLTGVASVADGPGNASCAVTTAGRLYCWGDLTWIANDVLPCKTGSCGGTPLKSGYAIPITTDGTTPLTGVEQAVVYGAHACVIAKVASAEQILCWGFSGDAQDLGLGDNTNQLYPTRVVGVVDPIKLVVADFNSIYATTCAIDGTRVRCWGPTGNGNTGTGNQNTPVTSPTLVVGSDLMTPLDGVVDLSGGPPGGFQSFCARKSDDTLWCWPGAGGHDYAANYGVTDVAFIGRANSPEFVTSDGIYHIGSEAQNVNCGAL